VTTTRNIRGPVAPTPIEFQLLLADFQNVPAPAAWPGHEDHSTFAVPQLDGYHQGGRFCRTCQMLSVVALSYASHTDVYLDFANPKAGAQ
jgi:hypothetical protein